MNILNAILSQAIFGQTEVTAADLEFRGIYDASGGVAPSPVTKGHYYVVSNGGTIGGTVYNANDFIWCNGTIWQRTPALLTGVALVNGQTGNVVLDTDDITEGVNKYVTASDIAKLANVPLNTNSELAKMFDKTSNTTDNITVGLTNLFLTALERAKLANVPNDTNTALNSKYTLLSNTMDDIINGTTYVKTENNFTDAYKNKLDNLTDNYKGSYADDTALKTAYPTGNDGDYATVQSTGTIWIWSVGLSDWADTLSGSIGDMLKSEYDSSNKGVDVYDMDNMDDGTTKVAMLLTERTKLSGLDAGDKLTVTAVEKSNIGTITDKVTLEEAQDGIGLILTDTNTIDFKYTDATPTIEADVKYQNSTTTTISDDLNGLKVDVEDNTSIQKVEIAKAGTLTGSRKRVNLIEGSNITITTTDNAVDDRVDLTITSNAVSGTIAVQKDDVEVVASVETLNFEGDVTVIDEGSNKVTVTVTGGSATDELVKISSNDTTAGYLEDKVVGTTNKITVTTLNDGDNEDLQIGIGTDIFDKSKDTMDNITDGTTYVKTENNLTDALKTNYDSAYSKAHDQNTDTGTSSDDFSIGDGTDTDKTISINNGDANSPQLKYNSSTNTWQYSNDGTMFDDMGSGSGGSTEVVYLEVTQVTHGFDNDFIYNNGTTWVKARANSETTTATHFAVRIDDNTFNAVVIGEVDVTGLLDDDGQALVNNTFYFLSQTVAGKLATAEPTTGIKQVVMKTNTTNNATISIEIPFDLAEPSNLAYTDVSNTFTDVQVIKKTSTSAFTVENDSGESIFNVDTDGNVVTIGNNYTAPTLDNEVATKKYVDDNSGGGTYVIQSKSSTYTALITDDCILCTNTWTLSLPAANTWTKPLTVKNIGTGVITIDANSTETIDGELTKILTEQMYVVLMSDGTNIHRIGG